MAKEQTEMSGDSAEVPMSNADRYETMTTDGLREELSKNRLFVQNVPTNLQGSEISIVQLPGKKQSIILLIVSPETYWIKCIVSDIQNPVGKELGELAMQNGLYRDMDDHTLNVGKNAANFILEHGMSIGSDSAIGPIKRAVTNGMMNLFGLNK